MSFGEALAQTIGSAVSSATGTAIDIAKQKRNEAIQREGWDRQDARTASDRAYQEQKTAEERDYQEGVTAKSRAYQTSQDERKRADKIADDELAFERSKELAQAKDSDKKVKAKKEDLTKSLEAYNAGNDTLDLIENIRNHPGFESRVGAKGASSLFGLFDTPIGGTDAAGVGAMIETLSSKNFMNSISQMKGMGALSDAEGRKVSAAVSSLDPNMPEEDFKNSLNVIYDITQRGMNNQRSMLADSGYDTSLLPSTNDNVESEEQPKDQPQYGAQYEPQQVGRFTVRVR